MASKALRLFYLAGLAAPLALVPLAPASADFFDDMRRTFATDIPHFFQDDIPCAFGAKPTSGAKTSCKSPDRPAKHAPDKTPDRAAAPAEKTNGAEAPPSSGR